MLRNMRSWTLAGLFAGGALIGVAPAYGQATVPELINNLSADGVIDTQRWDAALQLSAATFTDAAERQAALDGLTAALTFREIGLRVNAATALGKLGDPTSVESLNRALNDRFTLVRQAAAQALGRIGTEAAARALIPAVRDVHATVRMQAVNALGKTGQPIAVGALTELFTSRDVEAEPALLAETAKSLERLGGYATDTLRKGLLNDDPNVRRLASSALGRVGDPRSAQDLIRALRDHNPQVAATASQALSLLGEPAIDPLIRAFDDNNSSVRQGATTALIGIGAPAVPPLETIYNTAMADLADLHSERMAAELEADLAAQGWDPNAQAQQDQTPSLSDVVVDDPMSPSEVKRELNSTTKSLRTLNKERRDLERLVRYRQAEETFNQRIDNAQKYIAAPDSLPDFKYSETIIGVTPMSSPPVEENAEATEKPEEQTPRTVDVIDLEIAAIRKRAHQILTALGGIGDVESLRILTSVLQTGEVTESTLAAESLGRTRNADAVQPLLDALTDQTYPTSVRANAARGLGRLGARQAEATLTQVWMNDPAINVQQAARQALSELSSRRRRSGRSCRSTDRTTGEGLCRPARRFPRFLLGGKAGTAAR
ncbi:MAG: HEAT repeat domain-containing protein [Candidatus Poribacteria bacterium]|nr:HEAT repeat domain-containing protein [Candidatus Poribacteria bacterium]